MATRPLPSTRLVPSLPVGQAVICWQMAQIRCVCQPTSNLPGEKHADEVITDFTHHRDCYQSNVIVYLLIFPWRFITSVFFFPSVSSFDWPYLPLFWFSSLFNNNPLPYFILLAMMSSSIMALCSLSDLSDDSLSFPTFVFCSFPFLLLSPLCSPVSQC